MVDELAVLVGHLSATGVGPVVVEPEPGSIGAKLPTVAVFAVGRPQANHGFNTLGVDEVEYDVDVYVSALSWQKGEAVPIAGALRKHVASLQHSGVRAVAVSRPIRRPDPNPKMRRLGFTVTLRTAA